MAEKSQIKILPYLVDKDYVSMPPKVKPCGFKKGGETFIRDDKTYNSDGKDLYFKTRVRMSHTHKNTKLSCLICMEDKPRATQRWCRVCNTNGICAGCFRTLSSQGNDGFELNHKYSITNENLHNVKCPNCRSCGYYGPKGVIQTKVLPTSAYGDGPQDHKKGCFRVPKIADDLDIKKQTRVINTKLNEIMDIYAPLANKKEKVSKQNDAVEALPEIANFDSAIKIAELEFERLKQEVADKADELQALKSEKIERVKILKDYMKPEEVVRLNTIFTYMLMTKLKWFLAMDFSKHNVNEVQVITALENFTRPFINSNSSTDPEPNKWKYVYMFVGDSRYDGRDYEFTGYPTATMLADVLQFDKATFFEWFNLNIMPKGKGFPCQLEGEGGSRVLYNHTRIARDDFVGKYGIEFQSLNDYTSIPNYNIDCLGEDLITKINECVSEGFKLVELWTEISIGIKHPKVVEEDVAYADGGSKAQITSALTEDELRALLAKFSSK